MATKTSKGPMVPGTVEWGQVQLQGTVGWTRAQLTPWPAHAMVAWDLSSVIVFVQHKPKPKHQVQILCKTETQTDTASMIEKVEMLVQLSLEKAVAVGVRAGT